MIPEAMKSWFKPSTKSMVKRSSPRQVKIALKATEYDHGRSRWSPSLLAETFVFCSSFRRIKQFIRDLVGGSGKRWKNGL